MTGKAIAEKAGSVPDEMLSDHEWKTKMAAEGKAIYIPGKTVAEVVRQTAKTNADANHTVSCELNISDALWSELDTALPDIIELVSDIRNVCYDMAYQEDLDRPEVNSTVRLMARALLSFQSKEFEALDQLDSIIRRSEKVTNHASVK